MDAEDVPKIGGNCDAIDSILGDYPEAEHLSANFTKMGLKFENLSGLSHEDLELLGINNEKTREDILNDFANIPNQVEHYDEAIKHLDEEKFNDEVLKNVAIQLERLKTSLLAANLKFNLHHTNDLLANEKTFTSKVATVQINRLIELTEEMEVSLTNMKDVRHKKPIVTKTKKSTLGQLIKITLIAGTITLGGMMIYRNLKLNKI